MTGLPEKTIRLNDLSNRADRSFDLPVSPEQARALAQSLDILDMRKVAFRGRLEPEGKSDWRLEADLGATVVQPCVVSLNPVTTRIEEQVIRRYVADFEMPAGQEVEMPDDETVEPLPASLDLGAVLLESLSLALPSYPRAEGQDPGDAVFAEPGVTPLTDEDTKPFAGLAALRDKLSDEEPDKG